MLWISKLQVVTAITVFLFISACTAGPIEVTAAIDEVRPGIYSMSEYQDDLKDKRIGVVVNHTSMIEQTHLVDTLLALGLDVRMIFSPEHGFKGTAYNGESVSDDTYKGSIPIKSLHGTSKKPAPEDMSKVDIVVFDIQDVGARFYTYISTLHYVMETAAEVNVPLIILDRPNPNAHYVDGPVLDPAFKSFIGMHPVPVVYGMTMGEYGLMINGEGWLEGGQKAVLKVIKCQHYNHATRYDAPIPPSPNLPNALSIVLYPSLCFLEGTTVSLGRGTDMQFQVYGHPELAAEKFSFTPKSMSSSRYPKHQDVLCKGVDLRSKKVDEVIAEGRLNLSYLISAYQQLKGKDPDFFLKNGFFHKLAGNDIMMQQILDGMSEDEIRATWQEDLAVFEVIRNNYLLYK